MFRADKLCLTFIADFVVLAATLRSLNPVSLSIMSKTLRLHTKMRKTHKPCNVFSTSKKYLNKILHLNSLLKFCTGMDSVGFSIIIFSKGNDKCNSIIYNNLQCYFFLLIQKSANNFCNPYEAHSEKHL